MSPSRPLFVALTLSLLLGPACTPSSNVARQPSTGADSATEPSREKAAEPSPAACAQPADPAPVVDAPVAVPAPPPPPPVMARPLPVPQPSGPYRVRIVDAESRSLPTFGFGGRTYVMGTVGSRYSIVVSNPTGRRVEAVVSVDGLDAIDGHGASYADKRGYILPAYGSATIDGFRTSLDEVATFRFSSVADSYAGRLGQARDVGVIGVAFFPEREPIAIRRPPPPPDDYRYPSPARRRAAPQSDLGESSTPPAAPAPSPRAAGGASAQGYGESKAEQRRGLGTEFGEARESRISTTDFSRANATSPSQVIAIRYNDRAGLIALGIPVPPPSYADNETRVRETAEPFRETRFAQPPP